MTTIRKKDVIDRAAQAAGCTRIVARDVLQSVFEEIARELASGNRVEFREFGVFDTINRRARTALNPQNMRPVQIPERCVPRFRPGKRLVDAVERQPATLRVVTHARNGKLPGKPVKSKA